MTFPLSYKDPKTGAVLTGLLAVEVNKIADAGEREALVADIVASYGKPEVEDPKPVVAVTTTLSNQPN